VLSFLDIFPSKVCMNFLFPKCAASHSFRNPNNIRWRVWIVKSLIIQHFQVFCYFSTLLLDILNVWSSCRVRDIPFPIYVLREHFHNPLFVQTHYKMSTEMNLVNKKFCHCGHKILPLDPILSQLNPVHIFIPCFCLIRFNIIHTEVFQVISYLRGFLIELVCRFLYCPNICYMFLSSHPPQFDYPNDINVIMKLI
jgi:hypothetical protein